MIQAACLLQWRGRRATRSPAAGPRNYVIVGDCIVMMADLPAESVMGDFRRSAL